MENENTGELRLVLHPDPILYRECEEVTEFGDELKGLARRMFDLMYESNGLGLAGPQAGVSKKIAVINASEQRGEAELVIVNPVLELGSEIDVMEEGCLSFPGIKGKVKRASALKLKARNLDGEPVEMDADGILARALQHETDHLNGIVFINRMGPAARFLVKGRLRELEAEYEQDER